MFVRIEVYGQYVATLRYSWSAVKFIVDVDPGEASAKVPVRTTAMTTEALDLGGCF